MRFPVLHRTIETTRFKGSVGRFFEGTMMTAQCFQRYPISTDTADTSRCIHKIFTDEIAVKAYGFKNLSPLVTAHRGDPHFGHDF